MGGGGSNLSQSGCSAKEWYVSWVNMSQSAPALLCTCCKRNSFSSLLISYLRFGGCTQAIVSKKFYRGIVDRYSHQRALKLKRNICDKYLLLNQNHPSLWERLWTLQTLLQRALCISWGCVSTRSCYSLLWCSVKKQGTFSCPQPTAWPTTQHVHVQGKVNLQNATVVWKPTHHRQLQWQEHTGSLSQF